MTARLAFRRVSCERGDRLLFEKIDFELPPGRIAIVTGPNGVGKSSLLRLAAGLLNPVAGAVLRDGDVAYLGEQTSLDSQYPLARALGFWAAVDGVDDEAVATALAAMDIARLAEVPVRMLSTGQKRRAGLARVMLSHAPIWILDEPANGLDTATIDRLREAIRRHLDADGIVLAATHQPLGLDDAIAVALDPMA